jgi:hypothetical protein
MIRSLPFYAAWSNENRQCLHSNGGPIDSPTVRWSDGSIVFTHHLNISIFISYPTSKIENITVSDWPKTTLLFQA